VMNVDLPERLHEGKRRGPGRRSSDRRQNKRLTISRWIGAIAALTVFALAVILFVANMLFGISSMNSTLYFIKQPDGSIMITSHIRPDEYGRVDRLINFSWFFNLFSKEVARAGIGHIEYSWNTREGDGVIKEYRTDGTEFLVVLARYKEEKNTPMGVFIGGDLPLGDTERSSEQQNNNTGMAYYDGTRWYHIWCSLNEGFILLSDRAKTYETSDWKYLGSRVVKGSMSEVMIESAHEVSALRKGVTETVGMKRTIQKRVNEDYILLKVEFENKGSLPCNYTYELGDEPWVGDFYRGSSGNVGWTDGKLVKYESTLDLKQHTFAGYWDIGNDAKNEIGKYSGYADFMEWLGTPPDRVYFSNQFGYDQIDGKKVLSSWSNRIVSQVWLKQTLQPGEKRTYLTAFGMARPAFQNGVFFPIKPTVIMTME